MDGLVDYDVLDNERRKAVCELRKIPEWYRYDGKRLPDGRFNEALGNAIGVEGLLSFAKIRDRLIHLLGGDQPSGIDVLRAMDGESDTNGTCPDDVPMASITHELREWASGRHCKGLSHTDVLNIGLIADRIDEQFDRICAQQEAVLQSTIDEAAQRLKDADKRLDDAAHDVEMWRDRAEDIHANFSRALTSRNAELGCCNLHVNQLEAERDELLDLLRDAAKEYMTTQAVCDELRYQREELMGKWIRERAERQELQARLNKANGENKGLRLSIDEQKESIAQRKKTIGKLTRDNTKVWKTVHELQAKLDEYDRTHVELPKDANGEVFRVGCTVRMVERHPDVLLTVHSMTLRDDGMWLLYAWDDEDKYSCNLSTSEFEVCEKPQDTAESIVRELSMGAITESKAIERIEALND